MWDGPVVRLLGKLERRLLFRVPEAGNKVFLTFDDGPEPALTPWVMDTLAAHGAKATFFCMGRQAQAHPGLVERMRREGHSVGHHTWDHPNGWQTATDAYVDNVDRGARQVGGVLFRPPYGRLTPAQLKLLAARYQLVLWDVMGGDYMPGRRGPECAAHVLRLVVPGSIIVLHDNPKSAACLREALPAILSGLLSKGYSPASLDEALTYPAR